MSALSGKMSFLNYEYGISVAAEPRLDWGSFGKVRQAEEKRLKDPADVLIQAKEYKRSLKEKHKKKKR